MKILSALGQRALLIWSFILLFILSLASLFVRTNMPMDGSELSSIRQNNFIFYILLLMFFVAFWLVIVLSSRIKTSYLFGIASLIYILAGFYLIYHQNDMLRHDVLAVLEGARALNNGDYSVISDVSGYIHKYPHQLGLVSFERFILYLFGIKNVRVFFIINLLMAIADNFLLWRISDDSFRNPIVSRTVIILSFIFLPQLFFIFFVYGITFGLFFALIGLYLLQKYLRNRDWKSMILSVLFLLLSDIIRNNYIILIVSILIVLVLDFLNSRSKKSLIMIVALIFSVILVNKAITGYYKQVSSTPKLDGEPKIAWVAMGLDDNSKVYHRVPGWYDAYVENVYNQYKGDSTKIEKDSRKLILDRLKIMSSNPSYGFKFFKDKFISTWTDSLFESIWSGPVTKMPVENQKISGRLMSSIYEGGLVYQIIYYFSALLLILIYVAVIPFMMNQWRLIKEGKSNLFLLVPLIFLSGGVIFHLVWETKSQYTYPYVYLLLPLSAFGLEWLYTKSKIALNFKIFKKR